MASIEELIQNLASDNMEIKYEACKQLQSMEELPKEAINALLQASADPNPLISSAANKALHGHNIGSNAVPNEINPDRISKPNMAILEFKPINKDKVWSFVVIGRSIKLVFSNPRVWLFSIWIVLFSYLPMYLSTGNTAIECIEILLIPVSLIAEAALMVIVYYAYLGGFIKPSLALRRGRKTLGRLFVVGILFGILFIFPLLCFSFTNSTTIQSNSVQMVTYVYIPLITSLLIPLLALAQRSIVINNESLLPSLKISISMYARNLIPVIVLPIIFRIVRLVGFGTVATLITGAADLPNSIFAQLDYSTYMDLISIPMVIFLVCLYELILVPIESSAYTIAFMDIDNRTSRTRKNR